MALRTAGSVTCRCSHCGAWTKVDGSRGRAEHDGRRAPRRYPRTRTRRRPASVCEQDQSPWEMPYQARSPLPLVRAVREGDSNSHGLGHRILRLLAPRTGSASTCRPVSFRVVPRPCMSSCREQDVSRDPHSAICPSRSWLNEGSASEQGPRVPRPSQASRRTDAGTGSVRWSEDERVASCPACLPIHQPRHRTPRAGE
jgi:hypothetical protein